MVIAVHGLAPRARVGVGASVLDSSDMSFLLVAGWLVVGAGYATTIHPSPSLCCEVTDTYREEAKIDAMKAALKSGEGDDSALAFTPQGRILLLRRGKTSKMVVD
jgi:hypothetical protein